MHFCDMAGVGACLKQDMKKVTCTHLQMYYWARGKKAEEKWCLLAATNAREGHTWSFWCWCLSHEYRSSVSPYSASSKSVFYLCSLLVGGSSNTSVRTPSHPKAKYCSFYCYMFLFLSTISLQMCFEWSGNSTHLLSLLSKAPMKPSQTWVLELTALLSPCLWQ